MKHIVHTDVDNYIVSLELTQSEKGIEVPEEVFYSPDLTCYKYVEGAFIFDEEKKARLIAEEIQRQQEEATKPTTEDLAQAIDILTSIVLGEGWVNVFSGVLL